MTKQSSPFGGIAVNLRHPLVSKPGIGSNTVLDLAHHLVVICCCVGPYSEIGSNTFLGTAHHLVIASCWCRYLFRHILKLPYVVTTIG